MRRPERTSETAYGVESQGFRPLAKWMGEQTRQEKKSWEDGDCGPGLWTFGEHERSEDDPNRKGLGMGQEWASKGSPKEE